MRTGHVERRREGTVDPRVGRFGAGELPAGQRADEVDPVAGAVSLGPGVPVILLQRLEQTLYLRGPAGTDVDDAGLVCQTRRVPLGATPEKLLRRHPGPPERIPVHLVVAGLLGAQAQLTG